LRLADLEGVEAQLGGLSGDTLGEGGRLLSGGEGQRVRLARALLRPGVRLAVLDEPFRGVDRATRARLLDVVRSRWTDVTLILVTHDVTHTTTFDRVVVVDHGRVVENGPPAELATDPTSTFRRLLDAELANDTGLWTDSVWTRRVLAGGRLQ
jgi:ABC-type transport system involved in cytochrome bd biosynthesis fused ATPase/permease subunit